MFAPRSAGPWTNLNENIGLFENDLHGASWSPFLYIIITALTILAHMTTSLSLSWASTPALVANASKMFRWSWIVPMIDACRFATFASSLVRVSSLCSSSNSLFGSSSLRSLSSKENFLRRLKMPLLRKVSENYRLFARSGHIVKITHTGKQVPQWDFKTKAGQGGLVRVALFWKSHCTTCAHVWFSSMWPDLAKGLFVSTGEHKNRFTNSTCVYFSVE